MQASTLSNPQHLRPSTEDLLKTARAFGIQRKFTEQSECMRQVLAHPECTTTHKALVDIFFLDLERRRGDVGKALAGLSTMPPQENPLVEFRRLSALSEAHGRLAIESESDVEKTKQVQTSMLFRKEALEVAQKNPKAIEPDLLAYAIEGYIASLLDLKKIGAQLNKAFRFYDETVEQIPEGALKQRSKYFSRELMLSKAKLLRGDGVDALHHAGLALGGASNPSYQVYAAVLALQVLATLKPSARTILPRFTNVIAEHYNGELQNAVDLKKDLSALCSVFPELITLTSNCSTGTAL